MKVSSLKATAFLSAAVFAASVGTANAAAVDSVNAKCRSTNAKNSSKHAATISKNFDGCIKAAVKAGSGTCTTTAGTDTKGKASAAAGKIGSGVGSACAGATVALGEHQLCGTPVGGAIPDGATLATCLVGLNAENMQRWRNAILTPDYAAALADPSKNIGKCINAIAKNATKYFSTIQKEQSKAQNSSDKAGGDSNYNNPGDPAGKIGASATKLADGITKACEDLTPGQWADVGTCDDDLAGVIACVEDKTQAIAEGLIASAYDQPGSCPAGVRVQIHHDAADGVDLGPTELDVGWTGLGHNANVIDDFVGSVQLACGAAPDDCTSCSVTAGCADGNCRCTLPSGHLASAGTEAARTCATPFVQGTCQAGETCLPYFGPPLPLSAGNAPTCVVNKITDELVGNANLATGESDTSVSNRAMVYGGLGQNRPCPTCEAGLCNGGARNGLTCTVDGISEVFGATSYDCMPAPAAGISGAGLKIELNLTDDAVSLPFALPCDPPIGFVNCSCSTCTGDNSLGCNSNAECAAAGAGTCRTDGSHGGAPRTPNSCLDGTCEVLSGEEGVCTGENELFCDGFLKANGDGVLSCLNDGDCTALDSECPGGDCGTCTLAKLKKCFLNPIEADGTPGTEGAVLVSTFCSAPTNSGSVNAAAGTPGPSRLALDFEFFGKCADGSPWGPGGANCQ
jgi:hypothetical protein